MAVPYVFGNATTSIPLSNLDANFNTGLTIGNTTVGLGNTTTSLGNLTLANVTIISGSIPNTSVTGGNVTIGNTTIGLGNTATAVGNLTLNNTTITSVGSTFPNSYLANSTATIGNTVVTLGSTTSTIGNLTLQNPALGTPASGNLTNATADGTNGVGYINIPVNSQSAAYGLVLSDAGKTILHPISDNNARTFTIPANGSVAYPVGTAITFVNLINTVTIAITTDTMYLSTAGTTGSRTLAAYGVATAVKVTSTSWIISGNGLT